MKFNDLKLILNETHLTQSTIQYNFQLLQQVTLHQIKQPMLISVAMAVHMVV